MKKNKPDIRIDIFVEDIYLKSIPIDAKYRKLKNITNDKKGSLKQLLAYRDSPRSFITFSGAKHIRKITIRLLQRLLFYTLKTLVLPLKLIFYLLNMVCYSMNLDLII